MSRRYGIWVIGYEIWDMGYEIWDMGYGIWDMGYEIWDMGYGMNIKEQAAYRNRTVPGLKAN